MFRVFKIQNTVRIEFYDIINHEQINYTLYNIPN